LAEFNIPVPTKPDALVYVHKARQQELDLMADSTALAAAVQRDLALCNAEQRAIFDDIIAARSLSPTTVKCYFIYASGGCGKTFLLNLILREFRASGHISIATAFTGIAAPVE
jgi:predicted ATPase